MSMNARCRDCGVEWFVLDTAPDCHKDGHTHELKGVQITYTDQEYLR